MYYNDNEQVNNVVCHFIFACSNFLPQHVAPFTNCLPQFRKLIKIMTVVKKIMKVVTEGCRHSEIGEHTQESLFACFASLCRCFLRSDGRTQARSIGIISFTSHRHPWPRISDVSKPR